jgi:hypothetical protein
MSQKDPAGSAFNLIGVLLLAENVSAGPELDERGGEPGFFCIGPPYDSLSDAKAPQAIHEDTVSRPDKASA